MKLDEAALANEIKSGSIRSLYYFYGEEVLLVKTYLYRVLDKTVGKDRDNINLITLDEGFTPLLLSDCVENLPLFAEHKAVVINDLDLDKYTDSDIEMIKDTLENIPPECTVIIAITNGAELCKKAKNKKLITSLSKAQYAAVSEFTHMTADKTAALIIKKVKKNGSDISPENAKYIAELTKCNLTLASAETDKLCSYAGKREITRLIIDKLMIKQLDTSVYTLATELNKGNIKAALAILDDLFMQRLDPNIILTSLSSAYIDFYRAKTGALYKKKPADTAQDFGYPKNRAFVISKAAGSVSKLSRSYIRECLKMLLDADIMMKSTSVNPKTCLEQTVIKLHLKKTEFEKGEYID